MPLNTLRKAWDARIMTKRQATELIWLNDLDDADRAAWATYMDGNPPIDASGTQYVVTTPTLWNQVQVSRQTQFAWQWSFAVLHFAQLPTATPGAFYLPNLTTSHFIYTSTTIQCKLDCDLTPDKMAGVLIYATQPDGYTPPSPTHTARVTARWVPDAFPRTLNLRPAVQDTWSPAAQTPFYVAIWPVCLTGQLFASPGFQLVTPT